MGSSFFSSFQFFANSSALTPFEFLAVQSHFFQGALLHEKSGLDLALVLTSSGLRINRKKSESDLYRPWSSEYLGFFALVDKAENDCRTEVETRMSWLKMVGSELEQSELDRFHHFSKNRIVESVSVKTVFACLHKKYDKLNNQKVEGISSNSFKNYP